MHNHPDDYDVPKSFCPHCGALHEAALSVRGGPPKPDDATICINCGELSKFDEHLHLVKMSYQEIMNLQLTEREKAGIAFIKQRGTLRG